MGKSFTCGICMGLNGILTLKMGISPSKLGIEELNNDQSGKKPWF
jgi:hypothetical protein